MSFEDRYAFENFMQEHLAGIAAQMSEIKAKLVEGSGHNTLSCKGNYGLIVNSCDQIRDAVKVAESQYFIPRKSGYAKGLREAAKMMRKRALSLDILADDLKNEDHLRKDALLRVHFNSMITSCRQLKIDLSGLSKAAA